ncbi:hypothetical protein LZ480_04950 [Solibacillus sp. MA9]|uniref:Flagellar cap protein n=1 Tax=Solibacillus palustris TaxID=2908203 RepID=A0ABS9UAN6_9BACL|nr:hypothetical protein [Solibacillus sp. MA9]MCH7321234.1 hypothetical protein [Solibacillus sp. MA9]
MEAIIILSIIFGSGALIALTAILTAHKRSSLKLQIKMLETETQLEQIRMEGYQLETEKMRLELEHSKQLLLETRKD